MDDCYRNNRKIDPSRGALLGDGTLNDNDRVEIGPTQLSYSAWAEKGLTLPDLPQMRAYRLSRLVAQLQNADVAGLLLFDPLNIRYATDTTNMQLWNTHNPFRAALVCADGYMVLWDYKNAPFLADHTPLVHEVRSGASMFYFVTGEAVDDAATRFASEVADLLQQHAGTNRHLAVDKIMISGLRALERTGLDVLPGEPLTERARAIKGPDEIRAMRCAMEACEASVAVMQEAAEPGLSEDEIWSVLHAENIRRGGEWIETRLLSTGPRTNPWFQECGPRILQNNEILAFDTDLVGCYGICTDISRTWWIGNRAPRPDMVDAMLHAVEHIQTNMSLLQPGTHFDELTFGGHQLDPRFEAR
ncbi:MAG: M24 family metallopeptidase, partial [Dinoroseobacter sp.]|nr:M24 family metallopeptidase [Dinoroseobacter sp.]